jgi:DNA-binding transcriptional LysR family regulator
MAKIDLNRIVTFVRVAEAGSFTAAAAALSLPVSSVSRSVARLEDELGVRLLHRTTRRLNLTEAGQQYFQRMQAVVSEMNQATDAVTGLQGEPRGLVRLTTTVDLGVLGLASPLATLCRRHPGLQIDLTLTSRRVDLIDEGIDLAIRAGRLPDSTLMSRRLGDGVLGIYGSREYLKDHRPPRSLADVARHDCIRLRTRGGIVPWRLVGPRGEEEVVVSGPLIADEMMFVRQAVIDGLGLGLLPPATVAEEVRQGRLVRLLPRYGIGGAGIFLLWPGGRLVPSRVALVRDYLAEELTKLL